MTYTFVSFFRKSIVWTKASAVLVREGTRLSGTGTVTSNNRFGHANRNGEHEPSLSLSGLPPTDDNCRAES
eukprot:scaffold82005_cov57-Attheya_sp.AAC.2